MREVARLGSEAHGGSECTGIAGWSEVVGLVDDDGMAFAHTGTKDDVIERFSWSEVGC
jgi:hypothetical protein